MQELLSFFVLVVEPNLGFLNFTYAKKKTQNLSSSQMTLKNNIFFKENVKSFCVIFLKPNL